MKEFLEACKVEIEQLLKMGVWNVVPQLSIKGKLIPLKWVFTYKFNQDGYLIKYKARIVVRGDLQPKGSLDSTYAATLAAKSFRALMAFAAEHDLEIWQYNIVGAFLNAMITAKNPIWCKLPDGFKINGKCVKLNRALYRMRDSPLLWYDKFSRSL
jgi:hypothetical protein